MIKVKAVLMTLSAALILGCAPADRHFWYPIALFNANCLTFSGDVYLMDNSIGWRSNSYILEVSTKKEITLGDDCTIRKLRDLPKHRRNVQGKLTDEQKEYLIEGF